MRSYVLVFAYLTIFTLPCHNAAAAQTLKTISDNTKGAKIQKRQIAAGRERAENDLELGPGDKVLISAYERTDLSGKFTVRTDGTISIPLIGNIKAAGRTLSELDVATSAAIEKATSRHVPISLEVDTWRPVYAVGNVEKPGVYLFSPGMTVLHALASAGGLARPLANASPIELNRQMTIVHQSMDTLKTAYAGLARVEAEMSGKETIEISDALLQLSGLNEAKRLISAEISIMGQRTKSKELKATTKLAEIELIKREISAYKQQRVEVQKRIALNMQELKKYTKLQAKGLARSSRTLQVRSEIAALEGTSHTVLASIARAENSLINTREEKALLPVSDRLELDKELQLIKASIRRNRPILRLYGDLVNRLSALTTEEAEAIKNPTTYEIMRSVANRQMLLPANETTYLRPGDVVRVLKPAGALPNQFGDMLKRSSLAQSAERASK